MNNLFLGLLIGFIITIFFSCSKLFGKPKYIFNLNSGTYLVAAAEPTAWVIDQKKVTLQSFLSTPQDWHLLVYTTDLFENPKINPEYFIAPMNTLRIVMNGEKIMQLKIQHLARKDVYTLFINPDFFYIPEYLKK